MRWPKGPPHLALNLPYFLVCLFAFFVLSFSLLEEKALSLKKAIFVLFSVPSFVSPQLFVELPLFTLSFSVSLLCFSFFLPSFLFIFCFLLLPYFHLFVSLSCFFGSVLWKEQHQNIKVQCLLSILSCLVSCLAFSFKSLSYFCFFFRLYVVFLAQHQLFSFKKDKCSKTPFLGEEGRCNKTVF